MSETAAVSLADEERVKQILVNSVLGLWDVVNRIRIEFARRYPDISVTATDAYCWYDSDEQLRNGTLDVAFEPGSRM